MDGAGIRLSAWIVAAVLWFIPFTAGGQEARGPAGLPAYIRSPSDRPPSAGVEPVVAASNLSTEGILSTISPRDSVIVIQGKVDLGGRAYVYAYPKFREGSLHGAMKACRKEFLMKPQYKAAEKEGYALFMVVKDTATEPDCWRQFRELKTVDLSCDRIMVKTGENKEPVAWENPASSYSNSYDLRSFPLGPVTPR